MISRWLLVGRRRGGRREGETQRIYVDRPGGWILTAFFVVLGLSIGDAWFTLDVLNRGGSEANPVMRTALVFGDTTFVILKTVITILGAAFLCLHKTWPLGRVCLWIALLGYSAVTAFHLWGRLFYLHR
jgi:hypothetical protein